MNIVKLLIILSITILWSTSLFANEEENYVNILSNRAQCYIYAARVNVRAAPELTAEKIGVALIGESVQIVEITEKSEELYGLKAFWYKVEWKDKEAYIWGGLLSTDELIYDFDGDGRDEILLMQRSGEWSYTYEYMFYYKTTAKLCREGELINANPFNGREVGNEKIEIIKNRGFKPAVDLIVTHKSLVGGQDGGISEKNYFFWNGKSFQFIVSTEQEHYSEFMRYSRHNYITIVYPSDEKGSNNLLYLESRIHESSYKFVDEYSDPEETVIKFQELEWIKAYLWNGTTFIKTK